jgi:hypothetical protein
MCGRKSSCDWELQARSAIAWAISGMLMVRPAKKRSLTKLGQPEDLTQSRKAAKKIKAQTLNRM